MSLVRVVTAVTSLNVGIKISSANVSSFDLHSSKDSIVLIVVKRLLFSKLKTLQRFPALLGTS